MSDSSKPAAENAAGSSSNATSAGSASTASTARKVPEQNPALKMMGLPRLRLPSRNWMIFLGVTGSIAGAVIYDKWQTKRMREKWCKMVSHIADEPLATKNMPRRVTIYLAAPPGDGLRTAREHFHAYVKPVLVSAAMDWDVVEGRKEGDVRHKTAEKIRKRRKTNGEGAPLSAEEAEKEASSPEAVRQRSDVLDFPGVAGDIIIGRHTWIEYIRGLHEGYLGPADAPQILEEVLPTSESSPSVHVLGHSSANDAAGTAPSSTVSGSLTGGPSSSLVPDDASPAVQPVAEATDTDDAPSAEAANKEEVKKEEEKPQRRFPPSYILPQDYDSATLSSSTPDIIGPSIGVRFPHLLGIRNTPIRIYRFLTRRRLADDIGRQVAAAVLSSHRQYRTMSVVDEDSSSSLSDAVIAVPEQKEMLAFEQKDWWKSTYRTREEHEESVWIEPMALDDRIVSRMRTFQLTGEDEDRAKRIEAGAEEAKRQREER